MSDNESTPPRISLLGRFEVVLGDRTVIDSGWNRRKAKALIKLLALQPDLRLHRDRVIDALWPEATDAETAANNLYKNLHYIRRVCGEDDSLIEVEGGIVRLAPGAWIDVREFRRAGSATRESQPDVALLAAALALCPGDLLPDDLYEPWTEPHREEVRTLRLHLLLDLARAHQSNGHLDRAIDPLKQALCIEPALEEAHRLLMRAYAASGARDRALRQYGVCRDVLARELSVEPSAETQSVYRALFTRTTREATRSASADADAAAPDALPEIRYTLSTDGMNIAWCEHGQGDPLVVLSNAAASHLTMEWEFPEARAFYSSLAAQHRLIRYDMRGTGLSQRDATDFDVSGLVCDLEAVADAAGLDRFAILSQHASAPTAIAFAARYPERVSRMVLWWAFARGRDFTDQTAATATRELIKLDLDLYAEMVGRMIAGGASETVERVIRWSRESVNQETLIRFIEAMPRWDVTWLLDYVQAPTLVIHPQTTVDLPMQRFMPEAVAAGIDGAEFIVLDRSAYLPWGEEPEATARVVLDFVDAGAIVALA